MKNIIFENRRNTFKKLKEGNHLSRTMLFYNNQLKRGLDLSFAIFSILLFLPQIIVISILIKLGSPGPILYRGKRAGRYGNTFLILKFRTMVQNAEKIGGGTTAHNDPRITKIGGFLRKSKLDELPQLFNIIKGDMSFVGPRPELLQYTNKYEGIENMILEVRPGITDISSIEYISLDEIVGATNADEIYEKHVLKRKNLLRVQYVQTQSFLGDLKIMFQTSYCVLKKILILVFKSKNEKKHGIY